MQDYKCHWAHKQSVRLPDLFQRDFHIPPRQPMSGLLLHLGNTCTQLVWKHKYTQLLGSGERQLLVGIFLFVCVTVFKAQWKHTIHYLLTNQSSGSREQGLHWKFPSCPQTLYLIGKEFALTTMCHAYWRGRFFSQTNLYNIRIWHAIKPNQRCLIQDFLKC